MSRPEIIAAMRLRGSSMREQLGHGVAQRVGARRRCAASAVCAIVFCSTRAADRVPLGVVGVEQALRRRPLDHLGQLPAQVHRILHADVEALPAHRGVHVRGVAREQHAALAVGRRLPGHVGEPGDPGRAVHAVVRPVDGDERVAEVAAGWARRPARRAARSARPVRPARPSALPRRAMPPPSRRKPNSGSSAISTSAMSQLRRRVPARGTRCRPPCGSGCGRRRTRRGTAPAATVPSDSSTSTPVSSCAKPVTSRSRRIGTPSSSTQPARMRSKWLCQQREPVVVAGGEVADVQRDPGEACDLHRLPLGEEPVGDAALIEHLDGARVQTAGARAVELLARRAARR